MKRTVISVVTMVATCLLVLLFAYPAWLNVMCGHELDILKTCGRAIFLTLDQEGSTGIRQWPVDSHTCPRTSEGLIQSVADAVALRKPIASQMDIDVACSLRRRVSAWTVVKNMPPDAPDNLPVILSRNVDPASLTNHVSVDDFEKPVLFNKQYTEATDRMSAIIVYADGAVREYGVKRGIKYRDIYRNKVLSLKGGQQLKYLTPTGEVSVGSGNGTGDVSGQRDK